MGQAALSTSSSGMQMVSRGVDVLRIMKNSHPAAQAHLKELHSSHVQGKTDWPSMSMHAGKQWVAGKT